MDTKKFSNQLNKLISTHLFSIDWKKLILFFKAKISGNFNE